MKRIYDRLFTTSKSNDLHMIFLFTKETIIDIMKGKNRKLETYSLRELIDTWLN